jgi:hypothetical protein
MRESRVEFQETVDRHLASFLLAADARLGDGFSS